MYVYIYIFIYFFNSKYSNSSLLSPWGLLGNTRGSINTAHNGIYTYVGSRNSFKDQGCKEVTLSGGSVSPNSTEKHCMVIREESIEHLLPENF